MNRDHPYHKPYNAGQGKVHFCRGCNTSFKTKNTLGTHERVCPNLKMGKGDPFSKLHPLNPPTTLEKIADKVLPSSQQQRVSDNILDSTSVAENPLHNDQSTISPITNNDATTDAITPQQEQQQGHNDYGNCSLCKESVLVDQGRLKCNRCQIWTHKSCLNMPDDEYNLLHNSETTQWFCARCQSIHSNNLEWGEHSGEEAIHQLIQTAYNEILNWKKNLFTVPRGTSGNKFIGELSRLINLFVHKTPWEKLSLTLVHIFVPIMLQRPSAKSKPRENNKYLTSRLQRWADGDLKSIMAETSEIQKRMKKSLSRKEESREKAFIRLMTFGKIGPAAKFINNDDDVKGVHPLNAQIKEILQSKHPAGGEIDEEVILECNATPPEPVIFEEITPDKVQRVARNMKGSGGPTLVDSDIWRDFLCSKAFSNATQIQLCQSIADLAKRLCTEEIDPICLNEYIACRLVPLDKGLTKDGTPGVRPIGIGEVLRRIVGKLLVGIIKDDIVSAAGPLQTCTGLRAGIEAAIHAMRKAFENNNTEAILLVDAENAFNKLNREVALQNIKQLCPPFYRYLHNTYQ